MSKVRDFKSRHGYKYCKYRKCLSMIKSICIKQQFMRKLKLDNSEAELKNSIAYKKTCISTNQIKLEKSSLSKLRNS